MRDDLDKNGISDTGYAVILAIFLHGYVGFLLAYVVSLGFSLSTITYMLMRRKNDGTEMTEVYLEEEADEDVITDEMLEDMKVE